MSSPTISSPLSPRHPGSPASSTSDPAHELFLGNPARPDNTRVLLLGAGELGKEVAIELMRLGAWVCAADSYQDAPAAQTAHQARVLDMTDPAALTALIEEVQPDIIIPEIEAIATEVLVEAARQGIRVAASAQAIGICMDRERLRLLAAVDLRLPTTPFRFAGSLAELEAAVSEIGTPCVVKPVMSSSGHGQSVIRPATEAGAVGIGRGPARGQTENTEEAAVVAAWLVAQSERRGAKPDKASQATGTSSPNQPDQTDHLGNRPGNPPTDDQTGQADGRPDSPQATAPVRPAAPVRPVTPSRVIVEAFAPICYELTILTVSSASGILLCAPIGQRQENGDYRESWQPATVTAEVLAQAERIARTIVEGLRQKAQAAGEACLGVFGVELFVLTDGRVLFNEVSPRPHDTGLVTLLSQNLSEFALHARAVLGVPISPDNCALRAQAAQLVQAQAPQSDQVLQPAQAQAAASQIQAAEPRAAASQTQAESQSQPAPAICYASRPVLVEGQGQPLICGVAAALSVPTADLRLFGKPTVHGRRRLGVALASGQSAEQARQRTAQIVNRLDTGSADFRVSL